MLWVLLAVRCILHEAISRVSELRDGAWQGKPRMCGAELLRGESPRGSCTRPGGLGFDVSTCSSVRRIHDFRVEYSIRFFRTHRGLCWTVLGALRMHSTLFRPARLAVGRSRFAGCSDVCRAAGGRKAMRRTGALGEDCWTRVAFT